MQKYLELEKNSECQKNRVYECEIFNPHKSMLISEKTVLTSLIVLFFIYCLIGPAISSGDNPILHFSKTVLFNDMNQYKFFGLGIIMVWGPIYLVEVFFRKYFLKNYLSTVFISFNNQSIRFEYKHDNTKYCFTRIISLDELKSYGISKNTTVTRFSRGRDVISNLGIKFHTESETFVLKLQDYRLIPFGNFPQINGLRNFAEDLKTVVENYNKTSDRKIKIKVPFTWKKGGRFFTVIVLGLLALLLSAALISFLLYLDSGF